MNRGRPSPWLLPSAAVALSAGILIGRVSAVLPWALLALCCALAAAILLHGRMAALLAVFCALGCSLGTAAYHPTLPAEGYCTISGVITEDIRVDDGHVRTSLRSVTLNGERFSAGAYWSFYLLEDESFPADIQPGRRVTFSGNVYHPSGADNPGGYDFREYLLQKHMTIGVYGRDSLAVTDAPWHLAGQAAALRARLANGLIRVMGDEAGPWAATMLLGCHSLTPQDDRDAFARLGIAHILTVSGLHVGVLAGLLALLFRQLHLSRRLRLILTVLLLAAYSLLTGLNPPVLRASLLLTLKEYGALRHRQRSWLPLLAAVWILLLIASPAQLTNASMHLTFGAMLGITQAAPWIEARHTFQAKSVQRLWQACCGTLGAQLGVLLPTLYWFHELPLLGLILNIGACALTSGLMLLCWSTLFLLPLPAMAAISGKAAALLIHLLLTGVHSLSALPGITRWTRQANLFTALGWLILLLAVSFWWGARWRKRSILAGAIILALSVTPWPYPRTSYLQFSVGDADAALLRDRSMNIVIDTGDDGRALATYLHQQRLSIDALVITHLHSDHAGGIRALLDERIPVAQCYLPYGAEHTSDVSPDTLTLLEELAASDCEILRLGRGDVIATPSGSLTALWPEYGKVRPHQAANLSSLALLARLHSTVLLLPGDLDGTYEPYAAASADVLKIAHHGSTHSTSAAFLAAVSPQALILSRGDEKRRQSMEERRQGIPLYDTGANGAISLEIDETGFTISTLR